MQLSSMKLMGMWNSITSFPDREVFPPINQQISNSRHRLMSP